jgi:uncharacterized protein
MIKRYAQWIIRWRYFVLLATLLFVGLTTLGFPLKFDIDYRVFFNKDDPHLVAFETLQDTYTKNDNVMFVLAPKSGEVFTHETLDAVEWLTDQAWQVPYSIRVDSITNFQHTYAEGDDIFVEDLITDAKTFSETDLARVKQIALQEPQLVNYLLSEKAHVTGLNVTVHLPGEQLDQEVPEVVKFSRDLVQQLHDRYPNIEVYLTGMVIANNAFPEASKQDMRFLIPTMFIVIIILLWWLLPIFSGLFATLLVILFSTISAMGLAGLMGISLTGPSNAAPIVIFTLAIADAVHILTTFRHELWVNGRQKNEAIVESLRVNIQPIFLTSLTTVIGFLSMNFGNSPPFRDLGNISAMGIFIAFFLSISFLPALIAILPVRSTPKKSRVINKWTFSSSVLMEHLGEFVVRRRQALLWIMTGMTLFVMAFLPRNELNDIFLEYYDESVDFRIATDFTTNNLTGLMDIHYSLSAGKAQGITHPDFLHKVDEFVQWYYQQPEVIHINSITEIFKRLNKNMHGDDPNYYRLPEEQDLAAQYLLLYEMSLPYGLDLNNQINLDKSATRVTVTLKSMSTNELLAVEQRAQAWLKKNGLPAMQSATGSSSSVMSAHLNYKNIRGMLLGLSIALVLISLILVVALRSVKFGLISLVPNLVPIGMAFGVWGMLEGQVNLGVSAVAGLTIGIVVDDTIHYLTKYLRAREEKGLSPQEAVRYAFRRVGIALWITSVVLVAGFLVLTLSDFYGNFTLGLMTAMTITFALLTDFFLLPPLLMKVEEKT